MTEDQVTNETEEDQTDEQSVEPEDDPQDAPAPKKLSMVQRMDRIEELLVKGGVVDAASMGR